MNHYEVTFLPEGKKILAQEDTTLLEAAILAGLKPDAPCGGKGTCGKCLADVRIAGKKETKKACEFRIHSDLTATFRTKTENHKILTKGFSRSYSTEPAVVSLNICVEPCKKGESTSDWQRLCEAISKELVIQKPNWKIDSFPVQVPLTAKLYEFLKENQYKINVVLYEQEILALREQKRPVYAVAFDIGTTTVVGYLLSLESGEEISSVSCLNPQSEFGADVIGRSDYALAHGTDSLSNVIQQALQEVILKLVKQADISTEDIYVTTVVGNTCMHHLFLGISPAALVHAPYNATVNEAIVLMAKDYGLPTHPSSKLLVLPNIAGFVGADTIGVLLATDFDHLEPITLAIDIGTNGEMVLGNKERMVACSTAAGPAFEGAKITYGMRGAKGAIDHVHFEGDQFVMSVIGNQKPTGICGSGLMDLIAVLLKYGFLDTSGKLFGQEEVQHDVAAANKERLITLEGKKAFVVAFAKETEQGEAILLTQQDIREVQLAKGAMAAGISLMAEHLSIGLSEIEQVFIAGAFGNYMEPESACAIGLIPQILKDKIVPIGNAAGEGAKIAALSRWEYEHAKAFARKVEFLELASNPNFQDCFVDELEFPAG